MSDIRSALVEYLASTFALADDDVRDSLSKFLTDPNDGIFRGPYLRMRTPFRGVEESWMERPALDWMPDWFVPYMHQATAFERLATHRNHTPEPTIVTTGTGSGKTECFLYPILDHCRRERQADRTAGIKALILYPMNALATDQATRLADLIHTEDRLAGITAGLYVGGNGRYGSMGPNHLIDQREVLRLDPPDILLTNYKMLDYLLLRSADRDLWAANLADTLQYIVLDEFHTYDGAQGTDVAMLLRRLGATLGMAQPGRPLGTATPVATSATLGSGAEARADLRDFASKVFGCDFDDDGIITETRQTVEEACDRPDYFLPTPPVDEVIDAGEDLETLVNLFCRREDEGPFAFDDGWEVELGRRLLQHPLTRGVLGSVGEKSRAWPDAVDEIVEREREWGRTAMTDPARVGRALERFLWLISVARREQGSRLVPLFAIEVQLWVREVSRLLRKVTAEPAFRWSDSAATRSEDDLGPPPPGSELPSVYCRRCGLSGWMVVQSEIDDRFNVSHGSIYVAQLERPETTRVMLRAAAEDPEARLYNPDNRRLEPLDTGAADAEDGCIPVYVTPSEDDAEKQTCPACGERDATRFLGLRVASLASVSINTLFGSPHVESDERKLLAFTDSVQDASHRAAFFGGRTHRINLRSLMSRALREHGPDEPMPLDQLGEELWYSAATPHDRYGLIPPDLLREPALESIYADEPDPEAVQLLTHRLTFEAAMEFGLRARVGRTLELSGAAASEVHAPDLDAIADLIVEDLQRTLDPELFPVDVSTHLPVYLRGVLERLRLKGAIFHPLLDPFLNNEGRPWFLWGGRPAGLPPFTYNQSRPTFTIVGNRDGFDSLTALAQTPTWYVDWGSRVLGLERSVARSVAELAVKLMAKEGDVVAEQQGGSLTSFGLRPHAVHVYDQPDDAEPAGVRCGICGNRHAVRHERVEEWAGSPCLRYRCVGRYQPDPPREQNYYRHLYRSGVTSRVVTGEHTGLLDRTTREDLEAAFKDGTAPNSPNVITATPTLEMGIDIGDLSAVMLTSVPRTPANYIQRVGRAGRSTGNALVTTFVPTNTHGLYYLSQPEAMLSGDVRAPNCHLDAKDSLERQFFAYVLDRVADQTLEVSSLPEQVEPLFKAGLDADSLLAWVVEAARLDAQHVDDFLGSFGSRLEDRTVEHLRSFADEGLERRIKTVLDDWNETVRDLGRRRDRVNARVNELRDRENRSPAEEDELAGLFGQRALLVARLREARHEYTLSALQRYGLTPNYTLVDDSTTLEASMWWRDQQEEYQSKTFEYQRSASMALREFAPANSFYVMGHRHLIDAVDVGPTDTPAVETWQLCPDCGFGQHETEGSSLAACPRCESPGLADTGARHQLLRLTKAYSSSAEERARVFDEDDDRRRADYEHTTLVDVDPSDVVGAWKLVDTPFGAELARDSRLRSLNFGLSGLPGEKLPVGGQDRHITRFTTCVQCGAVEEARNDRNGTQPGNLHQPWCKVRSGATKADSRQLVLYHELVTEAVRFLLPVSLFEIEERLASFKGALLLGLREDFGGDPDHLRIVTSDMPNRDGQGRRHFLVLYDNVPGGTGYLAKLGDPERVREILVKARDAIARCACRNEARPACHRCLLGVVERYEYDLVRRDTAMRLLDDLLSGWDAEPIETVSKVDISRVEESELERRFKVALRAWAEVPDNEHVSIHNIPAAKGREAFEIRFTEGDSVTRWRLEEQEGLSSNQTTLPDFLLTRMDDQSLKVAVYLDGFQFHGSREINQIANDSRKRTSLRQEGTLVWNLTWNDVADFHTAVAAEPPRKVPMQQLLGSEGRGAAMSHHRGVGGSIDYETVDRNPMDLLLAYLQRPDRSEWARLTKSLVFGAALKRDQNMLHSAADVIGSVASHLRGEMSATAPDEGQPLVASIVAPVENDHRLLLLLALAEPAAERWTAVSVLPDDDESVSREVHRPRWRTWLQWSNLLQFLDDDYGSYIVGGVSQADEIESDLPNHSLFGSLVAATPEPATAPTALDEELLEELDLIEGEDVRSFAEELVRSGLAPFVVGREFDGLPVEVAWPEHRVAVLHSEQEAPEGWDARPAADWSTEELIRVLEERA